MGQAQINVRTRACSRTSIARTRQAALTHNVRGKELIKTVCTNNSHRVYTNVVTLVCGSVGRLNPTTVVQMYRSK